MFRRWGRDCSELLPTGKQGPSWFEQSCAERVEVKVMPRHKQKCICAQQRGQNQKWQKWISAKDP